MRISAKGHYALASLIEIAKRNTTEPIPVISISEALGVSKVFLEQVATDLKKNGLITSIKGAKGGYQLAKKPSDITALDVLGSVENALFETMQSDPLEKTPIISAALSDIVFVPLDKAIENCLSGITLQDLVDCTLNRGDSQSFMQHI